MFLSKEQFKEISQIFLPPNPINLVDKYGELKNMDSFYELEDFIKENIYDKKYPGVLPDINPNLLYEEEEFSDEEEEKEQSIEINKQNPFKQINKIKKKYKIIPNEKDVILFSEPFLTDDVDEFDAIKLLNEDRREGNENGWVLSSDKNNIQVYYKIVKLPDSEGNDIDSLFFYVVANINYPSSIVNKYANDFNSRKEFDNLYKQAKVLNEKYDKENNLEIKEFYLYLKMPILFTDRDFIIRKKIWKNYNDKENCFLINIKSIEDFDYPPKERPIRGYFINRSAYICPDGDRRCKLYLSTCFDMKVNIGISMMKNKGSNGQREWVDKFIDYIQKHEG